MILKLQKDATPIDFSYAVHTKVGDAATGCEINGKNSPLQSTLINGDVVKDNYFKKSYHHHCIGLHQQKLVKLGLQ